MEIIGAFRDPSHKGGDPGMGAQRLDAAVVSRQLGLRQGGVDFIVADLMQQHDRPTLPAAQLWDQMVPALFGMGRDRTLAERTSRGVIHDG